MRALVERGSGFLLAKALGHVGNCPVGIAVFKALRDRLFLDIGGNVADGAMELNAAIVVFEGALLHGLEGGRVIDAGVALHHGFGNDRGRVVAGHAAGFLALKRPHGHAVLALDGHADEAVDDIRHAVGMNQREERMLGAEGIPEREGGVIALASLELMHLAIHAAILAVHVVKERGAQHGVVERGVEDGLVFLVGRLHLDLRKLLAPDLLGLLAGGLEVPVLLLGGQVLLRAFSRNTGETGTDEDLFTGRSLVMGHNLNGLALRALAFNLLAVHIELEAVKGTRELEGAIHQATIAPGLG